MHTPADTTSVAATSQVVAQGSVSALLVSFYHDALDLAFPFIIPALFLILVDLLFGVQAAKRRKEDVRISRAIRRTIDKMVSYACWIILSATLSVAFALPNLSKIILGIVIGIELISVVTNYFTMRGKKVSGLWETAMSIIGHKVGEDLSTIKIEDDKEL